MEYGLQRSVTISKQLRKSGAKSYVSYGRKSGAKYFSPGFVQGLAQRICPRFGYTFLKGIKGFVQGFGYTFLKGIKGFVQGLAIPFSKV